MHRVKFDVLLFFDDFWWVLAAVTQALTLQKVVSGGAGAVAVGVAGAVLGRTRRSTWRDDCFCVKNTDFVTF